MTKATFATFIVAIVLAFGTYIPNARTQTRWTVTNNSYYYDSASLYPEQIYYYTAIAARGNFCMVAAKRLTDTLPLGYDIQILRSYDGGASWQTPIKIPAFADWFLYTVSKLEVIDSLHAVAMLDTFPWHENGFLIRTSDGGDTWNKIEGLPLGKYASDFDFSDSNTGIFNSGGNFFTTSDGGQHWKQDSIFNYPMQCKSYGHGMFRIWKYGTGPLFTTHDNWVTYDSGGSPIDLNDSISKRFIISNLAFGNGDTIIGYGDRVVPWDSHDRGALTRTTDGGRTWHYDTVAEHIWPIDYLSGAEHDTIYASTGLNRLLLRSTNAGESWSFDTVFLDTTDAPSLGPNMSYEDFNNVFDTRGIIISESGLPAAIFAIGPGETPSLLVRAETAASGVAPNAIAHSSLSCYPNPASGRVTVTTSQAFQTVTLLDMLGREVRSALSDARGQCTFDVATLAAGVYSFNLHAHNNALFVGKLIVHH